MLAVALAGCESIGEDFGDLGRSFMPPSPSEAARWAWGPDPDKRREGTLLLANAPFGGNPPYIKLYREHAEYDPDPLVRAVSIRGLARHGTPEDAPLIAAQLTHANIQVRWEAAKGLQRLHNPEVVGPLLTVVRNPEEATDIRIAAATALGQYPQDRVFQTLVAALDDRELALNNAAEVSLATLTGEAYGLDRHAWLGWYNSTETPFAGQREFLFPTYQRNDTLMEKLAFWAPRFEEQPAPPAGLEPSTTRRTYEDEDAKDQAGG